MGLPLRRALLLAALAAGAALTPVVACATPYAQVQADAADAASLPETAAADATPDVVLVDSGDPDALVVKDAGGKIDAAGCTSCDCDGDGFNDLAKPGCADAGGMNDCDDTDSRTHPGQGYLVDLAAPPRNGDWNCDGVVNKLYAPNLTCSGLLGATCSATSGFTGDPACGAAGTLVTCVVSGVSCAVGAQGTMTRQACK